MERTAFGWRAEERRLLRKLTIALILLVGGAALAAVTGRTQLGLGSLFLSVDHDPTAVATDAPKGSIIARESDGVLFVKTDDGSTTNVHRFTSAAIDDFAPLTPTKGRLLVADGTNWKALPIGLNGRKLLANSSDANGMTWTNSVLPYPLDWDADPNQASPPTTVTIGDFLVFRLNDGFDRSIVGDWSVVQQGDIVTDPIVSVRLVVVSAGTGNANATMDLRARYIGLGEQVDAPAHEQTVSNTFAVTDVVDQLHVVTFTLDRTLMSDTDTVSFQLKRPDGTVNDPYDGDLGIIEHALITMGP